MVNKHIAHHPRRCPQHTSPLGSRGSPRRGQRQTGPENARQEQCIADGDGGLSSLSGTPASSRGQPCSRVAYARHMLSLSQHPLQACKQPAGGGGVPQSWSAPQLLHRASCSELLSSASTPVREAACDPISQMTKLRLREAVSCSRPHNLQGQTSPVTQGL